MLQKYKLSSKLRLYIYVICTYQSKWKLIFFSYLSYPTPQNNDYIFNNPSTPATFILEK